MVRRIGSVWACVAGIVAAASGCKQDCPEGFTQYSSKIGTHQGCEPTSSTTGSSSEPTTGSSCGDEMIDAGEQCDCPQGTCTLAQLDGRDCMSLAAPVGGNYAGGTLACTADCKLDKSACTYCGDGVQNGSEACDCGGQNTCTAKQLDGQSCMSLAAPVGGNYAGGTLACTAGCVLDEGACTYCGDAVKNGSEACDNGTNEDPKWMMDMPMTPEPCANGCVAVEWCGDAAINGPPGQEECDDGNKEDTDACSNMCKTPVCGDGVKNGSEACDNGANTDPEYSMQEPAMNSCAAGCQVVGYCGDGVKNGPEACDDGNPALGDGCTPACEHEYVMFATKDLHAANFGGAVGADDICEAAAASAGLPGTYVAWVSVNMDDAAGDLPSGKSLVRRDGVSIVADAEELIQGGMPTLMNPVNVDEGGEPAEGYAWTGTTPAGAWSGGDCKAWTNATNQEEADVGALAATDGKWTKAGALMDQDLCDKKNHLYCFRTLEP